MNFANIASAAKQIGKMGEDIDMISKLVNVYNGGGNPMDVVTALSRNNKQFAKADDLINGKSGDQLRLIAENMCKERGTSVEQMIQSLGLKR